MRIFIKSKQKHNPSKMHGMWDNYQKMYDAIKNWNEASPPTKVDDGKLYNKPGHYIYGMGWALSDMGFHGWTGDAAENERYHYEEVRKAHKELKTALQNALGIKQIEKEY